MAKAGAALSNCINDLRRSGPETHVGTGFGMGTPRAKREPASRGLVLSVERERLQRLQRCASPMCFQVNMSSFFPSYMPTFPLPGPFMNFTLLPHPYPARPRCQISISPSSKQQHAHVFGLKHCRGARWQARYP